MAATTQERAMRGFKILTCALLVNLIRIATAEHSSALSHLYKKAAGKNRPLVLFVDNGHLNSDHDYKAVSREINNHKNFPYDYLQKLLEGYSHESYSNHRKPQYYNHRKPSLNERKFTSRYRYDKDKNRDDDERRYRYKNDKDRQDNRQDDSRDDSQNSRQDDRKYRDEENRNKKSRYRNSNDRRVRYRNDRDRQDHRQDDREYGSLENRDDRNKNSRYRSKNEQQYDERNDRYKSRNREDRKYRNGFYKERPRLRTGNAEQAQSDQQNRNQLDHVVRDKTLERIDREEDRENQDRNRQQNHGTASAQIPIVRSLLRSLHCDARDECENTCDNNNSCEDECAQQYECEPEPPKCTGSTRGERLVTEAPGCPRC